MAQGKNGEPEQGKPPEPLLLHARATISIEAKAAEDTGPAPLPKFSMVANTGAAIRQWWSKYPLVVDLGGMGIPSQNLPVRFNHDPRSGVGHTDSVSVVDGQLLASGVISRDTPEAKEIVTSSMNDFPWQASIGASIDQEEFIKEGTSVTVNGQKFDGPIYVVTKSTLGEISFVDLGADNKTKARVAAMAQDPSVEARNQQGEADDDGGTAAIIAATKAERKRKLDIRALVEKAIEFNPSYVDAIEAIATEAINEGWSVQKTDTEILRGTRARVPAPPRRHECPQPKVMEAALLMHCQVNDNRLAKDIDYGPDVVQQAWPLRHRGLVSILASALEYSGVRVPHGSRELLDTLIRNRNSIQADGFSTVNIPGILGNVANKMLLAAFTELNVTYDKLAEQADFSNFHVHTMYRLDHLGDFQPVPPTGEIKHGRLSSTQATNKLDTWGQIIAITRQDIINDDLNAFRSVTTTLARKARIAVEKAFISLVMESADSFYTVGQGNRLVGVLGVDGLTAAEAAMLTMTDSNGDPIFAMPRYILVPSGLNSVANSLFLSELLQGATSSTRGQPATNIFKGKFEVATSPFLSTTSLPGSSPTTWYLFADPNILPAFQVAYLDGRRAPTVETADAEFDTLGIQMRCFFDFGVGRIDYRGVTKSTAA